MSFSLYLYATEPVELVDSSGLLRTLSSIGLIAEQDGSASSFVAGADIMHLITYIGCSPTLTSDTQQNRVRLHRYPEITGMGGESIETVRYPNCRHPIDHPAELLSRSRDETYHCPQCGQQGRISDINWRRSAAYSNCFIEISPVFPKEAVPSDSLLDALAGYCHKHWDWFYSRPSSG